MRKPVIYDMTDDALYEAVRNKLATVPRDEWPEPDLFDDLLLSAKLRSMELGEQEAQQED